MSLLSKNERDVINQLQEQNVELQAQLVAERSQHAFDVAELQHQIVGLIRELAEKNLELARRDQTDVLARVTGPSLEVH